MALPPPPSHRAVSAALDAHVTAYVRANDFAGAVLVARGGRILLRKAYGLANRELRVPNSPATRFHIASVTKTFTAAAVLLLAREGRLSLDDPLSKFLPDFPNASRITVQQLLAHSAGVPDFYGLPEYESYRTRAMSPHDLVAWLATRPLDFEPGARSTYSNSGYLLLALVIEQASGMRYARFLSERLFTPLGMRDTGTWEATAVIEGRASGYEPWSGTRVINAPYHDPSMLLGSGDTYSTVDDLYRWCEAVREKRLFDVAATSYPFGWGTRERFGRTLIEQSGSDPGFVSSVAIYGGEDVCVIALGNLRNGAIGPMTIALQAIALGETPAAPVVHAAVSVEKRVLAGYVGTYRASPSMTLTVALEDGVLLLKGTGGYFLPLEALSDTRFFFPQLYVPLVFDRDERGKATRVLWDGTYACPRVE